MPNDEPPTMIILTKFEVDTTIRCRVTPLLLRYVAWPWPSTFWPWTLVVRVGLSGQSLHQVWTSYAYPFLTYELWRPPMDKLPLTVHLEPLRMCHITWPVRWGQMFPAYLKFRTPIYLPTLQLMIKIKWVICQNSLQACVKDHNNVCACAKLRDLAIRGQKVHIWNPRPFSALHYTTFMGLRWRLRAVDRWARPILKPF